MTIFNRTKNKTRTALVQPNPKRNGAPLAVHWTVAQM